MPILHGPARAAASPARIISGVRLVYQVLVFVWISAALAAQVDPNTALLERAGFAALEAGDARRATDSFREALIADPTNPRLHLGAGIAAYLERRDRDAHLELEQAITLDPSLAQAHLVLGRVLRREGDLAGAIRTYETLVAHHSGNKEAVATLERWRHELELHNRMLQAVGDPFTISFDGPEEAELAVEALEMLDRAYWRIGGTLGNYPANPIPVVLYTTKQFRDITMSPNWAAGAYDGTIRVPVGGALKHAGELERVLTHEFTHALVRSLAPRGVPAWLSEGLAAAFERENVSWAEEQVRNAGGRIPVTRLTTTAQSFGQLDAEEAQLAYASSAVAVARLMDEAGGAAVANLLRDLGEGVDLPTAFERRIAQSFAAFAAGVN